MSTETERLQSFNRIRELLNKQLSTELMESCFNSLEPKMIRFEIDFDDEWIDGDNLRMTVKCTVEMGTETKKINGVLKVDEND